jgi:hypothetical protein
MNTLPDKEVVEIAKKVGAANNVNFAEVLTVPTTDSTGAAAIQIMYVLTPGSSASIMGVQSSLAVSQLIQQLADKGEERFPIVRYEEKVADQS